MNKPIPLHAFKDNYIWLMEESNDAWVVDPGEAAVVLHALKKGVNLAGVLLTHHHHDHSGGIADLIKHFKQLAVIASHKSTLPYLTHPVQEGDNIRCGSLTLNVLEIPGHTLDHIAFYNQTHLFSGDTLFSAGCGRVFEGTPDMMYTSLSKIASLDEHTAVYCGHEYTLANLHFAKMVEPNNQAIDDRLVKVNRMLKGEGCSLPAYLSEEKKVNPFLRCHIPEVIHAAEHYSGQSLKHAVDVFWVLREWKNTVASN